MERKSSAEIKQEIFKNFINQTINSELTTLGNIWIFSMSITIGITFVLVLYLSTTTPTEISIKWFLFFFNLFLFFNLTTFFLLLYLSYKAKKIRKKYESIKDENKEFFIKDKFIHRIKALRAEIMDNIIKTKVELDQYGKDLEYYQNLIDTEEKITTN